MKVVPTSCPAADSGSPLPRGRKDRLNMSVSLSHNCPVSIVIRYEVESEVSGMSSNSISDNHNISDDIERHFEFDVGLSFAGEQRPYVEQVANELKSRGIRTFYDGDERVTLWGKNLYAYLREVYQNRCRYCVIFVSNEYASKMWPNAEHESAQARAIAENYEYILPVRFDDIDLPGLPDIVGYVDLDNLSPRELADLIEKKIGKPIRYDYLPPILDRLHERLGIEDDTEAQQEADRHAMSFMDVLRRMTLPEREAVIGAIRFGCPAELPDNVHISADLLSRYTGASEYELSCLLGGVRSLGFDCSIKEDEDHGSDMPGRALGDSIFFYLNWSDLRGFSELPALQVAREMIFGATERYCEEHGSEFLKRLDFSQLATATVSTDMHSVEE